LAELGYMVHLVMQQQRGCFSGIRYHMVLL
jgi:hypothetical protein